MHSERAGGNPAQRPAERSSIIGFVSANTLRATLPGGRGKEGKTRVPRERAAPTVSRKARAIRRAMAYRAIVSACIASLSLYIDIYRGGCGGGEI